MSLQAPPSAAFRIKGLRVLDEIPQPLCCDSIESRVDPNDPSQHLIACGMYQLREGSGGADDNSQRIGSIVLYRFNTETKQVVESSRVDENLNCAGVFDMKWNSRHASPLGPLLLAAACADGAVALFDTKLERLSNVSLIGNAGFCLALDFEPQQENLQRICVSCSTGEIHVVDLAAEQSVLSWPAHWYAHDSSCPAEIWTIAWGSSSSSSTSSLIASGADDGVLKLWDCRSPDQATAVQTRRSAHDDDCGVCSLQFDPYRDFTLLSGGYDGKIRMWDVRSLKTPVRTTGKKLGGGVWRVRAAQDGRVLGACMRGGFRVLSSSQDWTEEAIYSEAKDDHWEALAYGADWITDRVVAGCSFYDKRFRLFELEK